jgi:hypothetical protein
MEKPIVSGAFELRKGKEKGSWTFIEMPILKNVPKKRNSTVRVRGTIDAFEIRDFHIWAMKKGTFMAVKAAIRKAIGKEAGDSVALTLFLDEAPMVIREDLLVCLREEPALLARFENLPKKQQKEITDWVFAAGTDDGVVARIGKVMEGLETGKVNLKIGN